MSIFFDFSEIYKNEYSKRMAGASFYKFLDYQNIDLDYFVKEIIVKENTFLVACSSMERRLLKDINFSYYKNFFLRPKNSVYQLVGDFVIENNNESYFKVKDLFINDSLSVKKYEKEFSFEVRIRVEQKKCESNLKEIRSIVNETINVYDYRCLDFVRDFDSYLEFEKKYFLRKLGFYKSDGFKVIELKEIKRNLSLLKKYEDVLYFDDGNNYFYVDGDSEVSEPYNSVMAVEFLVSIRSDEGSFNKLQFFVSQEIEIANVKEALEGDKLITSGKELEFSFKTRRLGSLLAPLEEVSRTSEEITYRFSKFWSDEDSDVYFSFARVSDYITSLFGEKPLLVNILSGDVALYKRGKQALKDLKEGNVKSPGIASCLFNISEYETREDLFKKDEIEWSNNSLDRYQKEAVFRALNSNSIFLLQGPPGTGKTQTITEMVYQFNKRGKKVLLSSQTHVAIDNVIERLPDELNVLPIRLINSERKMKASKNYLPDKLVDNFYDKMKNKYMNKEVNFIRYSDRVESSFKKYEKVKELVFKYKDSRDRVRELKKERNELLVKVNECDNKLNVFRAKINDCNMLVSFIKRFKNNEYKYGEYDGYFKVSLLKGYEEIIKGCNLESSNFIDYLRYFMLWFKDDLKFNERYLKFINSNKELLDNYCKESLGSVEVYKEESLKVSGEKDLFYKKIRELGKVISGEMSGKENEFRVIDDYFDEYFSKVIVINKRPLDDEKCLEVILEYISAEKEKFLREEKKYLEYKDIYKDVTNFISEHKEELLESTRVKYTKYLLNNNANVYSITCNANSKYLEEKNEYLKKLGLGNIELKNIDFDVVIIDEVSKANGVELLIPILYGKSIILVGDHRQLPPLFKYREKMFEDVSKELLMKYESLVENSLFKELFKKARFNKYMLVNQYRSHEQIMDIVNIFYDDKLRLGNSKEQNEAKRHYLNVSSNGYSLFEENIHTYWFNSHYDSNRYVSYEKKRKKGSIVSTSFYNEEEIYLTGKILKALDKGYKELIDTGELKEACSVGVISLYGDQVSELKKEVSKMKFEALNFNKNKVSTVDEFQGKEEDIIIVNFVRNNPLFEAGDFVRKFERINVALSRARKMLIIVGSKPFFTSLNVKMESMDDDSEVTTRKIYKEIYERVIGKIDEPNIYFKEVVNDED